MSTSTPAAPVVPAGLGRSAQNGQTAHARGGIGSGDQAALLEEYYEQWKTAPESVDPTWRSFFEGFELGCQTLPPKASASAGGAAAGAPGELPLRLKQARLYNLLFAYRTLGHRLSNLDPLGFNNLAPGDMPELSLEQFRFTEADLDTVFDSGTLAGGGDRTLREILEILRATYCGTIGSEYMHIQAFPQRRWVRDCLESGRAVPRYAREKKKRILNNVLRAEEFENFLHVRYVGQKRFSLEGGETLIAMLDAIVEACPGHGIAQVCMGMAHRGRLNVLTNILGKDYKFLFTAFAENYIPQGVHGDGDVKYHLGYDAVQTTSTGERVGLSLAPNPSHLEAVNPVVEGKTRAHQRLLGDTQERKKALPILIHGDAAMAGQGIVFETINLSQLEGYRTGGTVHIVVNNQLGFTTLPQDSRSTTYCTAIAKGFDLPVFHVNGDDPLSAVFVTEMALEYRQKFGKDVVIDLVCYRRHGHNEGDEPNFTQPTLYSAIAQKEKVSQVYLRRLVADGDITEEEARDYVKKFEERLSAAMAESKAAAKEIVPALRPPMVENAPENFVPVKTAVPEADLVRIGQALVAVPEGHQINAKVAKVLEGRRAMTEKKQPLDWSGAEALAFGSLLDQGHPIRLSGQDSRRGTFSSRHSVLYDVTTRKRYLPLQNIAPGQAQFCVYNSPLSEYAVLGFDYGYSLDYPKVLVLWEAQFGDFANGAQTMIDQYITSAESKWEITSNLTMLLPHGYDGQGPEHSSARLERFLQACAEDNIIVAYPTTPAQYFHLLRRQALRETLRKPLVVMTPKGMLRDKRCTSALADLTGGAFQEILADVQPAPKKAKRLILCAGKVYHDLADYRAAQKIEDAVLVRVEQLYPLHGEALKKAADDVSRYEKVVWCQEESQNMGAWSFIEPRLRALFGREILYAGRDASSSPAVGALALHKLEQADLIAQAFKI
ncbi:MAG: 2-oxoglutarate dehydrogenase E1 component [Verrucomicrobium sp.]|nr:2-oxoglutarate dehydrogenase E1 component [Verrucomicrobium sp.]